VEGTLADDPSEIITVFAAASLTEAFTELAGQFESSHPGTRVVLNFAGSQQLAQQLAQGAPADVFASADLAQMEAVVEAGRVRDTGLEPFAHNRLVVIFPAENPGNLQDLTGLARPGLKLVLADAAVPVGRYSLEFLANAAQDPDFDLDYLDAVKRNIVSYEENVRSVLSKVRLGEADAGIVYTSDLVGESSAEIRRIEIPDSLNVIATYFLAPISDSESPERAGDFVQLVLSPAGRSVLTGFGFGEIE
jgi:molybdate transport system substrate-binding protein